MLLGSVFVLMGLFGSDKEVVKNAKGESVTEERLFEKSGRVVQRLAKEPIIEYLSEDEQPHFIFVGPSTGLEINAGGETDKISPGGMYHAFLVLTDERIVALMGQEHGDEKVAISYDEIQNIRVDEGIAKSRFIIETKSGEGVFHLNESDEIEDARSYVENKIPSNDSEVNPPSDSVFESHDESDVEDKVREFSETKEGEDEVDTEELAEMIAEQAPGRGVKKELLMSTKYLDGSPLVEYFDEAEYPAHIIEAMSEGLLITTNLRVVKVTPTISEDSDGLSDMFEVDYDSFEVDEFGESDLEESDGDTLDRGHSFVTFEYEDIDGIWVKEGRLSNAVKWEVDEREFKIKPGQAHTGKSELTDLVEYVREKMSSLGSIENIGELVENAKSDTVTHEKLSEYNNLIRNKLNEGEQPHYILNGNPLYGIKTEGGASTDDQSAGLLSPVKTLQIKAVRTVLTDERILLLILKRTGHQNTWNISYSNVTGVDRQEKATGMPLIIQTHGRTYYADISKEAMGSEGPEVMQESMEFVQQKAKENEQSSESGSESVPPIERLERIKELHEKGAISDEEFEEKKEELLDKI